MFYNDSISPVTKIVWKDKRAGSGFYNDSISPVTKIIQASPWRSLGFTMTQFLRLLKSK